MAQHFQLSKSHKAKSHIYWIEKTTSKCKNVKLTLKLIKEEKEKES